MSGHARLAPSSAGRWGFCPGSVGMEERYPDDSKDGLEGEASHWVGAELLHGRVHHPGEVAPNSAVLDQEMVNCAGFYHRCITNAISEQPYCFYVEQPLTVDFIHPDCWGTPDLWYFLQNRFELHVWDYKYGWGIVDVIRNLQLILYAIGALQKLGLYGDDANRVTIVLHIMQPRPQHPLGFHREWRTSLPDLVEEIQRLRWAAAVALSADATCHSGPHCRYCRARHACFTERKAFYAAFDYVDRAQPQELSPEALGIELQAAERAEQAIKYHLAGLQAQAMGLINKGTPVDGWMVERGQGRMKWNKPVQEIFALGDLYNLNLRAPEAAITPAQARTAGLPATVLPAYADTPQGDAKLVRATTSLTAQIFGPAAAQRARAT